MVSLYTVIGYVVGDRRFLSPVAVVRGCCHILFVFRERRCRPMDRFHMWIASLTANENMSENEMIVPVSGIGG